MKTTTFIAATALEVGRIEQERDIGGVNDYAMRWRTKAVRMGFLAEVCRIVCCKWESIHMSLVVTDDESTKMRLTDPIAEELAESLVDHMMAQTDGLGLEYNPYQIANRVVCLDV